MLRSRSRGRAFSSRQHRTAMHWSACLLSQGARVLPVLPAVAGVAWPLVVLTAGPQRFALLYKTRDATVDF